MEATAVVVPIDAIKASGRVLSHELTQEGIWLEVIDPDEVPGKWTRDYSSWPPENRPPARPKPDIALALRSNYGGLSMSFLDDRGTPLPPNPGMTAGGDGPYIFYWVADPVLDTAVSLRIGIMRD